MTKNRLYVHLLLDRSGSMEECRDTAIGAFNEYASSLRANKEMSARISLTLFDDVGIDLVYDAIDVDALPKLNRDTFQPRGMTPLNDAIGGTVAKIDQAKLLEDERVAFVVLTDGMENASKEYTKEAVKKLLDDRQKRKNWLVIYLGANQDAFAEGASRGAVAANTMTFDVEHMPAAMKAVSRASSVFAAAPRAAPPPPEAAFTPAERAASVRR